MLVLRSYQKECIQRVQDLAGEGKRRQLISLPTGSGKTVIFSHLIKQLGLKTLVLAHANELLEQARDKIHMIAPDLSVGIVNANHKDFESRGISSATIFGNMPSIEREVILKSYKEGSIEVLCNCQVLAEGFDAPETSCIIIGRPTRSKGLYLQMLGRGLRPFPNKKECLVLDLSDTAHSICSTATLLGSDEEYDLKRQRDEQRNKRELVKNLPARLNQKLKVALVSFDPLGESYLWKKEGGAYVLSGGRSQLIISPECNDHYRVILNQNGSMIIIAKELSFEYAFGVAEEYAKNHRSMFVMADREALWRNQPISEKQKACFRSFGYRSGIEELTKRQASDLLASGILKRTG